MKNRPIEVVLDHEGFSETEKKAFLDIIEYAKSCQKTIGRENLKSFVDNKISEVAKNEAV